jgi:hypothetical protein
MPIKIPIETTFDPKGTSAAIKELTQVAAAKAKLAQSDAAIIASAGKVAQSQNQVAMSVAKASAATSQAAAAQSRAAAAALRYEQAQERAAKATQNLSSGVTALPRTFAGLTSEMQAAASGMLGFGAAMGTITALAGSFKAAFDFKTELDSTTASINIQLKGVRDSGQVWNEAAAYANKYKLTQAETSSTVQASIGILRNSQASVEDTFSVLQRMTLLAPGKTIEDAAFSVRELASGDIVSIADQFNISKTKAYEMRDAIVAGGDTVALLGQYLDQSGISMDALKVKTEGAAGAQKDLAIAAEQLQLAQAEFAAGPGLTILQAQIALTGDATKLLKGDFTALGDAINDSGLGALNPLLGAMGNYNNAVIESGGNTVDWIGKLFGVEPAASAAANATAIDAVETQRLGAAHVESANAATTATVAIDANASATGAQLIAAQGAEEKTRLLTAAQAEIASLGGAVAGGLITSANAAAQLASQYGITAAQAELLINAQARIAGGKARLAGQAANTKDLTNGGIGFNAPGRGKGSDADIMATINKTQGEIKAAETKGENARAGIAKTGGAARASTAKSTADQLVSIEQSAADKIMAINQRLADAQIAAQRKLASDIETSTADMIADQEANDLDLIGAKEENMGRLRAREEAEGNARIAQAAAVSEAQARAAAGDAETASAVLDIREANIQKQQSLDEDYANKRAELAGNPEELAALEQQYNEATQAYADATATRVALAEAEAQQKKAKAEEEKAAALAAAAEAGSALAATGKSASSAMGMVDAMIARLHAIPTSVTTTINVKTVGGGSGSSADSAASSGSASVASAGGGTFMTNGPTHFTVGDNPGGHEIVSVTPVGGKGSTSVHGNVAQLAGGGVVDVNGSAADAQRRLAEANARAAALAGSLPRAMAGGGGSGKAAGGGGKSSDSDVMSAIDKAISLLDKIADLRDKFAEIGPPLDMATLTNLIEEAQTVYYMVKESLVPTSEKTAKELEAYTKASSQAIDMLGNAAGLRTDAAEVMKSPLDMGTLTGLVEEAQTALIMVKESLVPITETQVKQIERYADASSAAIGLLSDASKLRADAFSDYKPPTAAQINRFAKDADITVKAIAKAASTYSAEGLTAAKSYSEALGGTYGSMLDGLKFIEALNTGDYAVDMAKLTRFTNDSLMLLDKTKAIGAKAAEIPAGNIAAINAAAGALSAYGQSMINIAAVPDIQSMSGYAGGGGSSTSIGGVNIVINPPASMDVSTLANLVISRLNSAVGARR